MRAFQVTDFSAPPCLGTVQSPAPQVGQVGVRICAAGLNFADLLMCKGTYQETPEPPFTLGLEASGIVDALGEGVTDFQIGDRVAVFSGSGGLAEYGVFPSQCTTALSTSMSFSTAAGFQIVYGTSHLALTRRARLQRGETLLVLGAAGGVGLTALEIGKTLGARVIAVARGTQKLEIARAAGADHLIDLQTDVGADQLTSQLKELGGADVVYDPVGGDLFNPVLRACNPLARYIAIGFASGAPPQIPANHLLVKNIDVIGFYWGGYMKFRPDLLKTSITELFALYEQGTLKPHISHTFSLREAGEGLRLLKARQTTGKVVVEITPSP